MSATRPDSNALAAGPRALDVAREAIGGEHELAAGVVQRVEGVEELLLGPGLGREELDVVDEQDVGVAIARLEAVDVAGAKRGEELVGEGLDRRVADGEAGAVGADVVADRVQEMGLADAGRAVEEERVVGLPGQLGDGQRGGVGEAVAVADHELVEGVLRVQARRRSRASSAARGRRGARPGLRGARARRARRR